MSYKELTLELDALEVDLGRFDVVEDFKSYATLHGITATVVVPIEKEVEKGGYYAGTYLYPLYDQIEIQGLDNGLVVLVDDQGNEVDTIHNWTPSKEDLYKLKSQIMEDVKNKVEHMYVNDSGLFDDLLS